jgi:ribosomal protein S18 acetylase RimI-like enzyme
LGELMVRVRDVRPGELDAVAGLLLACFREHLPAFPEDVGDAYLREVTDVDARASSQLSVAERDGQLVGSVTFLPDARHDTHPWPPGGSVLRLLAVLPAARGRGVGGVLTDECISRARQAGAAFLGLHTAPFMFSARRLYERYGFARAPDHDFDPYLHYGDRHAGLASETTGQRWGLAYILPLSGSATSGQG